LQQTVQSHEWEDGPVLKQHLNPKIWNPAHNLRWPEWKWKIPNSIEFYFGSVAPGGYAWIFPKGDDIANVGLGIITTQTDKTAYEHLLEFVSNCPSTQNAQPVELNIGGDPVGGMLKKLVTDNLVLVGDSASQVSPLTGGGIISAMKAGVFAGEVTAAAIKEGNYSQKRLKEYQDKCEEEMVKTFNKELKVKKLSSKFI